MENNDAKHRLSTSNYDRLTCRAHFDDAREQRSADGGDGVVGVAEPAQIIALHQIHLQGRHHLRLSGSTLEGTITAANNMLNPGLLSRYSAHLEVCALIARVRHTENPAPGKPLRDDSCRDPVQLRLQDPGNKPTLLRCHPSNLWANFTQILDINHSSPFAHLKYKNVISIVYE